MSGLNKLAGFRRAPAGLEWVLFRRLPRIAIVGTALGALAVLAARLAFGPTGANDETRLLHMVEIATASLLVLHWTVVFTVAIGCVIVILMKGPAYVADGYELPDRDAPDETFSSLPKPEKLLP